MTLKVLSIFDGFFVGGSRVVHSDIVAKLHEDYEQVHSVLSLTSKVSREYTTQRAENTETWKNLKSTGVDVFALDRTQDEPFTSEDIQIIKEAIDKADVILSLKEQPLVDLHKINAIPDDKPLIVSIHRSDPEHQGSGLQELVELSRIKKNLKIIACAQAAKKAYVEAGIPETVIEVVENGIDLSVFRPDAEVRDGLRQHIGASEDDPVVAIAARFDEMKNVPLFVHSSWEFFKLYPNAKFIACGAGMTKDNPAFQKLLDKHLPERFQKDFHALGIVKTADIYPAADIVSLTSSFGEAAPLCILEAMACGAIPVSTDVGDTVLMIKGNGFITSSSAVEIAQVWKTAFKNRKNLQTGLTQRRDSLSDRHMVKSYATVIKTLVRK